MVIVLLISFLFIFSHNSLAVIPTCPPCPDIYCDDPTYSSRNQIDSINNSCQCPCLPRVSTRPPRTIPTCQPLPSCYYDQDHPCAVRPEFDNQYCPPSTPTPAHAICPTCNCSPLSPPIVDHCPFRKYGDFDCDGKITVNDYSAFLKVFIDYFDRIF